VNWLKRFSETAENNHVQNKELASEVDAVKTSAFSRSVLVKKFNKSILQIFISLIFIEYAIGI